MIQDPSAYVTAKKAAEILGVRDSTIRAQINKGKIRAEKLGSILLIAVTEVQRYARENQPKRRGGRPKTAQHWNSPST